MFLFTVNLRKQQYCFDYLFGEICDLGYKYHSVVFIFHGNLKAYSLINNRGRSQTCQNLNFLYISVALL